MKVYFNIYKNGKFITKDFAYCIEWTRAALEGQGYTIEIAEESNEDNNVITIE